MSQKILLPTPDYPPQRGGVARYLEAIKKTFSQDIQILYLDQKPTRNELIKKIEPELRNIKSIWISHIFPYGTVVFYFLMKRNMPYTLFLHGMDFDLARRNIFRKFAAQLIIRFAENVIANSQALASEIEKFSGRKDVRVIYPTVCDEFIKAAEDQKESINKNITLLTVSRLVERKGHIKVLEAMKDFPDIYYSIVGDGPFKDQIKNKIREFGLEDRVKIFTGIGDDRLPEIYRNSDIFVMPTTKTKKDREGFGIVYLEAQLFRLPVIATRHPGVDEAIIDRGTGFLIEDHPDALKFALNQLIKDADLRKRMGRAGSEFVKNGFKRENQFKKLAEII